MSRRFRKMWNDHDEWSVADLQAGYRICNYNHTSHGGVHVHGPEGAATPLEGVSSMAEADSVMRRYAATRDRFKLSELKECVNEWRSASLPD